MKGWRKTNIESAANSSKRRLAGHLSSIAYQLPVITLSRTLQSCENYLGSTVVHHEEELFVVCILGHNGPGSSDLGPIEALVYLAALCLSRKIFVHLYDSPLSGFASPSYNNLCETPVGYSFCVALFHVCSFAHFARFYSLAS